MVIPPIAKVYDQTMGLLGPVYVPNDDLGDGSGAFRFFSANPGNVIRAMEFFDNLSNAYASIRCDADGAGGLVFQCSEGAFFDGPIQCASFITGVFSGNDIQAGTTALAVLSPLSAWTMVANATAGSATPTAVNMRALPTYLAFSGNLGIATFTGNGQACISSVTVNGAVLAGRGSTYDLRLANQAGSVALSVPANTTNVVVHGNCTLDQIGRGFALRSGTNARCGVATLAAGTVTVSNNTVTANTQILLTSQGNGASGTPGFLRVSAKTASTSFVITSSSGSDTQPVFWQMFEVT